MLAQNREDLARRAHADMLVRVAADHGRLGEATQGDDEHLAARGLRRRRHAGGEGAPTGEYPQCRRATHHRPEFTCMTVTAAVNLMLTMT